MRGEPGGLVRRLELKTKRKTVQRALAKAVVAGIETRGGLRGTLRTQ